MICHLVQTVSLTEIVQMLSQKNLVEFFDHFLLAFYVVFH